MALTGSDGEEEDTLKLNTYFIKKQCSKYYGNDNIDNIEFMNILDRGVS